MDRVSIVQNSAEPSVARRLYCRYIFYALYTSHTHLPKRDAGKFRGWEFCPNPRPTTFHATTRTSQHVAHRSLPSSPIAKHNAHQHRLLKATTTSTLQCPTYSCRNPVIPAEFRWNPQEFRWNPAGIQSFQWNSSGIHRNPQEFRWNSTGIKLTKVEILYLTLHFVLIYRTTYFSLLSFLFLHLFKSVSHLQSVYFSTLPLEYNFK